MDAEKVGRIEQLICDLIKQIARSHVKINAFEDQLRQLQQQIVILEQDVCALLEKENNKLSIIS